jgi:hypothetical protein
LPTTTFKFHEEVNMQGVNSAIIDSVNNIDMYIEENKEAIEKYLEYINSNEAIIIRVSAR